MADESARPEFVYRLATPDEWLAAQANGVVPARDIDRRDGYIHLSTRGQALETARLHFAAAPALLALEIPFAAVAGDVRFEPAPKRGADFPHLYGVLRADHVARAIRLERDGERFRFGDE